MQPVGIDLGTGNSVVAIYRRGRTDVLNVDGETVMPSAVSTRPGGGLLVGLSAKRRAVVDPENTVLAIKRRMGDREYRVSLNGTQYSPVDVSSMILKKLVEAASEQLGETVKDAVISVPAYFSNNQKEDTRQAGEQAGLNVLRLIPEPTAAAVAYGLNKDRDQTILVYDLGAGTFDVSILEVKGHQFTVKGIGGDQNLGGEDFDRCMINLILQELRKDTSLEQALAAADPNQLHRQIKESAERAKKELSTADTADVEIADLKPGAPIWFTVSRQDFENAIRELVGRTIEATFQTLQQAKLTTDDVDRIVLVGGSTRVPLIQQTIKEKIRDPYTSEHVDQVVAHGAAILAASHCGLEEYFDTAPVEIRNITAHSLGIRAAEDKFAVLIPRGTALPAEFNKTFTTARANADSTEVEVFQGEAESCSTNEQLGGFHMGGIQRAPAGTPKIDVGFRVDEDDILTVTASDQSTKKTGALKIEKFQPKPYEPQQQTGKTLETLRIGVSPPGCDDAGGILRRLGLQYKLVENQEFRDPRVVSQYDVLFINCLCDLSQPDGRVCDAKANKAALHKFVSEGGVLYVSDFAYRNITDIFPPKISFSKSYGKARWVNVQIMDSELKSLVGGATRVHFNTIYVPVVSVDRDVTVYMATNGEPILVSFAHGEGHVVYTSFHNNSSISDELANVVRCVILQTISLATSTPLIELSASEHLRHR